MDATSRAVMRALVERGHFPETPDGFRDAVTAALDITAAFRAGGEEYEVGEAVCRALYPEALVPTPAAYPSWDDWDDWNERFEADQDAVWEAFRNAERNVA